MDKYCPFYQKECIGAKCVLWEDECLLISFLRRSKEISKKTSPEEIRNTSIEELTEELLQFTLKELKEIPDLSIYDINELFWLNKNIEKYSLVTNLKIKVKKAETIVASKIKEIKNNHKNELNISPPKIEIKNKIPEEIINATTEELAEELFEFSLKELKDFPGMDIYDINELFWQNKNIDEYLLSNDLKLKLKKAEIIAKYKLEHYDRKEIDDLEDYSAKEDDLEDSFEEVVTSLSDLVIKKKAPKILRNPSPEELAETIVSYTNETFPQMDVSLDLAIESYLESIGYKRYNLPMDIRVKIENAEKFIVEKLNEKKLMSILPEILNDDPNELANKIVDLHRERYPDHLDIWLIDNTINNLFYNNKISSSMLSTKNLSILENAKNIAKEIIKEEKKRIFEKEKKEVTDLIDLFYNWAKENGFNKVTLADTDAFLNESEIELSYSARRDLYSRTNVKLKSKK